MTSLSIFNDSKFWLCYHVNLVFKVGLITYPQIYCTTHHIKCQLAKIVPSESVTKIVALEKDLHSAEYLTISISKKKWQIHSNSLLRSKLIKIIIEKSHIEGLLQLTKNISNKTKNWSSVMCFIKDLVCIFLQYFLHLLVFFLSKSQARTCFLHSMLFWIFREIFWVS